MVGASLLAAPARAEISLLQVDRTASGVVLSCDPTIECGGTDECDGFGCADVNTNLSICLDGPRQLSFEIFCCDTVDDCPRRDGADARSCSHVAGDVSVCLWSGSIPRAYNFCSSASGSPTFEAVIACFDTNRSGLLSLAQGDCDGDGLLNAADPAVCVSDIIRPPTDGGTVPIGDLGVDDLGSERDGSTQPLDLGTRVDSGSANPQPSFQGGGGCAVAHEQAPAGVSLLVMLGALAVGRRRRARG